MKNRRTQFINAVLVFGWATASLLVLSNRAFASFPSHIDSAGSAALAVQQFGKDPTKFEYCVYQALVDKDEWQLAVASHDALHSAPSDPDRECCFVESFAALLSHWEPLPPNVDGELGMFQQEADGDIKDAAAKLPNSFEAHLAYGDLINYSVTLDPHQFVVEVEQYRKAEELRPKSGAVHDRLASAYWRVLHPAHLITDPVPVIHISEPPKITMQLVIQEELTAVRLYPADSECYLNIAFYYGQADFTNYPLAAIYLRKYIDANPGIVLPKYVTDYQTLLERKLGGHS